MWLYIVLAESGLGGYLYILKGVLWLFSKGLVMMFYEFNKKGNDTHAQHFKNGVTKSIVKFQKTECQV